MARNADEAVLRDGTGSPFLASSRRKPDVGRVVIDVHRVGQGKQQVDVQQVGGHGASSRSRLTSSRVTGPAFGWTGKSGTPSRVALAGCCVSACRAKSESTLPIE